jgi:mono/diheme cytochrome c family protein
MTLPRLIAAVIAPFGAAVLLAYSAQAEGPNLEAGKALAEKHCATCHAVGPIGASRLPAAPPFRDVAARYSVWNLEEALAEGIVTGHAEMPQFVFKPAQITDLLGYMETLAKKKPLTK